jgi:hypothetical protein
MTVEQRIQLASSLLKDISEEASQSIENFIIDFVNNNNNYQQKFPLTELGKMILVQNEYLVMTSKEVAFLCENNFYHGAIARWRSIYELHCIILFINIHGEDSARAYLRHKAVKNQKDIKMYKEIHKDLGLPPYEILVKQFDPQRDNDKKVKGLLGEYGNAYKGDYGWSRKYLSQGSKGEGGFKAIEREVGNSHMRLMYNRSSGVIHSSLENSPAIKKFINASITGSRNDYNDAQDAIQYSALALVTSLQILENHSSFSFISQRIDNNQQDIENIFS